MGKDAAGNATQNDLAQSRASKNSPFENCLNVTGFGNLVVSAALSALLWPFEPTPYECECGSPTLGRCGAWRPSVDNRAFRRKLIFTEIGTPSCCS